MQRTIVAGLVAMSCLVSTPSWGAPSLQLPRAGGLARLALEVDLTHRSVRYRTCGPVGGPCAVDASAASVPIPGEGPIEPSAVVVEDVALVGGRHLAHVRVTRPAPSEGAWEALVAAGAPPLFAGATGWTTGEAGERAGLVMQILSVQEGSVVVVGDLREDLRICGDDVTPLDTRALDPATLAFHHASLQRLARERRDTATDIEAVPLRSAAPAPLAQTLSARGASSNPDLAAALVDGDASTAWSEARAGRGQGEFVLLSTLFDVPIERFAITVAPSHGSANPPREDGASPERLYLATGAGTFAVSLPEDAWAHPGESYSVALPRPIQTSCVALVLDEAFTHAPHPRVTVAELTAYTAFDRPGATFDAVAERLVEGGAASKGAAAILEAGGRPALDALVSAYPRFPPSARALAVDVAAAAASCSGPASRLLILGLVDEDPMVSSRAKSKLEDPRCGRAALPDLQLALAKGYDAPARVAPLVALFGRERAIDPLALALSAARTPDDRRALRSALGFAARHASPESLAGLVATSKGRPAESRIDLLRALRERLGELTTVVTATVREVLAARPNFASRYLLVDLLASADASPSAVQVLGDLAQHDDAVEVRARAAEGLARMAPSDAAVLTALVDEKPRVRFAALRALPATAPVALASRIVASLEADRWTFVRVAAADALARLPATEDADRALVAALRQHSPMVREHATVALGAHGASRYAPRVLDRLRDPHEDVSVRVVAATALGALCADAAADDLMRLMVKGASSADADDVSLGLAATEAIGRLHPADLASRVASLRAGSVRPDARAAAKLALETVAVCPLRGARVSGTLSPTQ